MAKSRPFAYNPGSQIPGTQKFGNLTVGSHDLTPDQSGVQWWNGPDEDLGYVIAQTNVDGLGNPLQPTPTPGVYAGVGFYQTQGQNDSELIALTNMISGQSFTTVSECKTWLEANNRWTSWSDFSAAALSNFKNRVLSSYGTFESETTLLNQLKQLDEPKFNAASLIITPNAYKEGELYTVKPTNGSGDMSFNRTSGSGRVNELGELEPVPYNLMYYSEQFDNSFWNKRQNTLTSNQELSPINTLTGDLIVPNTVNGEHSFNSVFSSTSVAPYITTSGVYNWSIYVKPAGNNYFLLRTNMNGAWTAVVFNLATKSIQSIGLYFTNVQLEEVANGWFLLSCSE